MATKSLKIKNESMFYPNDMIQLNNFDCQLLKINKRENRENNNIYYISYKINKPEHDVNSINNLYFVVDHLYGKIEKINGSKDRYLVINEDSLMNEKNINFFYYLWNTIVNKIKYSRGDDIMFDDNEVIIKDWNKIRFRPDIFIPNDVSINFYSLVIVINYVIEKNDEFIPEIYINEGYFTKVSYKMNEVKELKIDSTLFAKPAKLVNLLDFKPEKLSIKTENNKLIMTIIHQVRYENGGFYLAIDNLKGYFGFIDNSTTNVVLNMIFSNDDQKNKYHQVWKEIFKIVDNGNGELKLHEKIVLSDSDISTDEIIKISSITIVVSITIVIKSLIEKDNKFYLELALNHLSYQTIKK